jgi:CheY-like chemotaxis protein
VSLRILFADDSVTAQNMGKKILTEAGYDVVAVSNGAAAVKKIAEQKPDIIILDVYMPGYTGLEVCEKVRGSMETLKTPVLLTVGKMEPYKAEEGNRVRADGVIIKPFEASDLLAIVKKFEERIGQTPAPPLVRQAVAERFVEEDPLEHPEPIVVTAPQPTVEVPDHMATASAFSDLLGTDSTNSINQFDMHQASPAAESPAYRVSERSSIPEYELPVSWRDPTDDIPRAAPVKSSFSSSLADEKPSATVANPPAEQHPPKIPVYQDIPEPAVEIVPTAAGPIGDVDIPREPALEESAAEATRATVADSTEPGLIPTLHHEAEMPSPMEREAAELAPVESHFAPSIPAPPVPAAPPPAPAVSINPAVSMNEDYRAGAVTHVSASEVPRDEPIAPPPAIQMEETHRGMEGPESDFEARVAAAMAAYSHVPEAPMSPAASVEAVQHTEHPAAAYEPEIPAAAHHDAPDFHAHAEEAVHEVTPPAFESRPPARSAVESAVEEEPVAGAAAVPETFSPAHSAPTPSSQDSLAAHIAAALPAAAAAAAPGAETGSDHHTIAEAVHRVMERLKPELVEEIVRELKSKK